MFHSAITPPRISTLILLTATSTLSLTMFLPSLANMAADFQVDYAVVNLSMAGYLLVTAVVQLIVGPLSDRYGRRPVLLAALAIFALASIGCALATDIWMFLGFRILQGIIISGWTLSQAAIRDMAPAREAASLMGHVAMAMAIAPMLAPLFGGVLDELFGWRASFLAFTAMGVGLFILCWVDLGETNEHPSQTFTKQFRAYPELFRSRRFWGYAICMGFSTAAFYVFLSGVPLVAETVLDLRPAKLGFYMGTITAGFFLGSFLSARYAKRYRLTTMMIAGRIVACAGLLLGLAVFAVGIVNAATLFGATVFLGIGNGLTMPSANAGALSVRPQLAGSASGLSGALIVGAGVVMTTITGTILTAQNGPFGLVGLMLLCAIVGLAAALYVRHVDRGE